jgi:hypothetical protein
MSGRIDSFRLTSTYSFDELNFLAKVALPRYDLRMAVITEADLFSRVIDASNPTLTPEAATGILQLAYSESDHARMAELAEKSNSGTLNSDERRELESYVFVGDVLSLLKSKARLSLRKLTLGG